MKFIAICYVALLLLSGAAGATVQITDSIEIEGESRPLLATPLNAVIYERERNSKLAERLQRNLCSASWRGYSASWRVENDQLLLLSVRADPCGSSKAIRLSKLFGWGVKSPVLAEWFSGELVIARGKMTGMVRGWELEYEEYLVLEIRRGKVAGSEQLSAEEFYIRRQGETTNGSAAD